MPLFSRDWRTGQESWLVRLWRIRLRHAIVICLPFWFILLWYIVLPIFDHFAYNHAVKVFKTLDIETFHLHLYDQLQRDARRFRVTPGNHITQLPKFEILMSNDQLDKLDADGPPSEGKVQYAKGLIRKGSKLYKAKLRYRGYKHWNWNYAQKSWKISLEDELLLGQQTFSFINPSNPAPFMEQIVLAIARKNGLLTPDYFPIRLYLNGTDMGVYWFMGQPDEFLLRRHNRIPGAIYSGNRAGSVLPSGASSLFWNPKAWKKPASRHEGDKNKRDDLQILLEALQDDSGFAAFARAHLDLSKFALLEALDILFGCSQHNWDQDHKFYFDPYRGRWEPIAWDFRRFEHKNTVNLSTNPLQLRLRELPEYVQLRYQWMTTLLNQDASPHEVEQQAKALYERLTPEFAADAYWDAYGLLPGISSYYRQWVRPLNEKWAQLFLDATLAKLRRRAEMLHKRMRPQMQAFLHTYDGGFDTLHILVDGEGVVQLRHIDMIFDRLCPTLPSLTPDYNDNGRVDAGEPAYTGVSIPLNEMLVPGYRAFPLKPVTESRGTVYWVSEPRQYIYLLPHEVVCRLLRIQLTLTANNDTWTHDVFPSTLPPSSHNARKPGQCDLNAPPATPGRKTIHPWCLKLTPRTLTLGPGDIFVDETMTFGPETIVKIQPGTRFWMHPDTSMFFFGPVTAHGTPDAPIQWLAVNPQKPWGGVVLQGEATQGSSFSHIRIAFGSHPSHRLAEYPAMLNLHDTQSIRISHAILKNAYNHADAIHAAYMQKLHAEDIMIETVSSDAVDAEFVSGRIVRLKVHNANDECLDTMGSTLDIKNATLMGCKGNAISAGERSRLQLRQTIILQSGTGLLAKNNSEIDCDDVILYKTDTGVRIEKKEIRYEGASHVKGQTLFIVKSRHPFIGPRKRFGWSEAEWQLDDSNIDRILPMFPGVRNVQELARTLEALANDEEAP